MARSFDSELVCVQNPTSRPSPPNRSPPPHPNSIRLRWSRAIPPRSAQMAIRCSAPTCTVAPRPVFSTRGFKILSEPQIIKEQHLKLRVAGGDHRPFEAIWWRGLEETKQPPQINQRVDLAYELEANRWNGDIRLQLNVKDMKLVNGES